MRNAVRTGTMTTIANVERQNLRSIERVYHLWDEALGARMLMPRQLSTASR
jgi:hypothetical protein